MATLERAGRDSLRCGVAGPGGLTTGVLCGDLLREFDPELQLDGNEKLIERFAHFLATTVNTCIKQRHCRHCPFSGTQLFERSVQCIVTVEDCRSCHTELERDEQDQQSIDTLTQLSVDQNGTVGWYPERQGVTNFGADGSRAWWDGTPGEIRSARWAGGRAH